MGRVALLLLALSVGDHDRRAGLDPSMKLGITLSPPKGYGPPSDSSAATTRTVAMVHGHPQTLRLYGDRGGRPAIVLSGDGGWIHLAPHIAEWLAAHGWFVVGVDSRAYLSSVTDDKHPLSVDDIPHDYSAFLSVAGGGGAKPLLVGVSEGAGLSVAAAADPMLKSRVMGLITVGLADRNELAWHLRDAIIYLTKGVPREPLFRATDLVARVAPVPLAMLRSTNDEYVPQEESDRLIQRAREPKASWTIPAVDHRFSNNLSEFDARLSDAISWIASGRPH